MHAITTTTEAGGLRELPALECSCGERLVRWPFYTDDAWADAESDFRSKHSHQPKPKQCLSQSAFPFATLGLT
jgi:hypothetical protein